MFQVYRPLPFLQGGVHGAQHFQIGFIVDGHAMIGRIDVYRDRGSACPENVGPLIDEVQDVFPHILGEKTLIPQLMQHFLWRVFQHQIRLVNYCLPGGSTHNYYFETLPGMMKSRRGHKTD